MPSTQNSNSVEEKFSPEIVEKGSKIPLKTKVSEEQKAEDTGCESSISSSPTTIDDEFPLFSDIPIMRVGTTDDVIDINKELKGKVNSIPDNCKPQGSAYISIQMSIGSSSDKVDANLCVDTVCSTSLFVIVHFSSLTLVQMP